jgi:hypothetical protein
MSIISQASPNLMTWLEFDAPVTLRVHQKLAPDLAHELMRRASNQIQLIKACVNHPTLPYELADQTPWGAPLVELAPLLGLRSFTSELQRASGQLDGADLTTGDQHQVGWHYVINCRSDHSAGLAFFYHRHSTDIGDVSLDHTHFDYKPSRTRARMNIKALEVIRLAKMEALK